MDVQSVSVVVAAVGLLIAAINQIYTSRQANVQRQTEIQTRQAELFMQLYEQWKSPEFRLAVVQMVFHYSWDDINDFMERYGPQTNPETWVNVFIRQATFYEGVGVLVEQGLIDINLVDRLLHNTIIYFWEHMGPILTEMRKNQALGEQPYYDSAEYLYRLIKRREPQQITVST
jgi:hypothetical protein